MTGPIKFTSAQRLSDSCSVDIQIYNSRIRAMSERVRECSATALEANGHLVDELGRIFGHQPVPETSGNDASRLPNGDLDELDGLISVLSDLLGQIYTHTQRLSSI